MENIEEFIMWLSGNVSDFNEMEPEQIVTVLNEMASTDEGKETIVMLYDSFQEKPKTVQKAKYGAKLDYLIKLKKGGKTTKKCKCGCEIKKVLEKGGVINKCSCGCKK